MGTFPTSSSTGTLGDFTVSPEFHTHNHMLPGAIDMAALTALATSETVNTDVLQMVLSHQVSMTKMVNEAAEVQAGAAAKEAAAKREHELAICDRVMAGLPVVINAVIGEFADERLAELERASGVQGDLLQTLIDSMSPPRVHPAPPMENGKGKRKSS